MVVGAGSDLCAPVLSEPLFVVAHEMSSFPMYLSAGARAATHCSIVSSALIVLFIGKTERLPWAFVCLQILSPIAGGAGSGAGGDGEGGVYFWITHCES